MTLTLPGIAALLFGGAKLIELLAPDDRTRATPKPSPLLHQPPPSLGRTMLRETLAEVLRDDLGDGHVNQPQVLHRHPSPEHLDEQRAA